MISPATSGEIFTSVSGCTLPVAETVCTIVLRTAFSVVTGIGFSRFELMMETMIQRSSNPSAPKMIWRLRRERRFFAICGVIVGAGVVAVWCMKFVVRGARRARINLTLDLCKAKHVHTSTIGCGSLALGFNYFPLFPPYSAPEFARLPTPHALRSVARNRTQLAVVPANRHECRYYPAPHRHCAKTRA